MKRASSFLMAILAPAMIQAAADPAVYRPVAAPAAIRAGQLTSVRVSAMITPGAKRRLNSAVLWRSDSAGVLLSQLGSLNDAGVNGDLDADDRHYSLQITMEESRPGVQYFRITASIEGVKDPIQSAVLTVEALPSDAPLQAAAAIAERTVSDPATGGRLACDGIAVFYAKGTDFRLIQDTATRMNGRVNGIQPFSTFNAWNIAIPCTDFNGLSAALRIASADARSLGAEPEAMGELLGLPVNDTYTLLNSFPNGSGLWYKQVGLDKAWMVSTGSRTFTPKIAIVDTGIDYTHEDLKNKVIKGKDFQGINDNDPMDEDSHGTTVAGLAGAATNNGIGVVGAAPDNKLIAIRIANKVFTITHMVAGIENAVQMGAHIINMSWGTKLRPERLAAAVDDAYSAGKLCVGAAGNDNENRRIYPAAFNDTESFQGVFSTKTYHPHIIAVGGVDAFGGHAVWFINGQPKGSNYGSWVDIQAPAVSFVTTTLPGLGNGNPNYTDLLRGTSGAAGIVSGAAALVWSGDFQYSSDEVRDLLVQSATDTGRTTPIGGAIRMLSAFTAVVRSVARTCDNCLDPSVQAIVPAPFPSTGIQIHLGSIGGPPTANRQHASVHGVAFSVRFQPFIRAQFITNLRSCDAYVPGAFYDLFSMSMANAPYWELPLTDDVRPLLNSFFTARAFTRQFSGGCDTVGVPVDLQDVTRPSGSSQWLSIVLDTRTLPFADTFLPSWGTVTIEDLSPQ